MAQVLICEIVDSGWAQQWETSKKQMLGSQVGGGKTLDSLSLSSYTMWDPTRLGMGKPQTCSELMAALQTFLQKRSLSLSQFCTQFLRAHTTHLPHPLSVAIKSSTPGNPACLGERLPSSDAKSEQPLNTPRKHLLSAAASTAVTAVSGAGAAGKDGDFRKTYGRVALQGWTLLDPNDQGPPKEVLTLPASQPQNPCSALFPSRRNRQEPWQPPPQHRHPHHQRAQTINYPPSWRRLPFNFPDYHKD